MNLDRANAIVMLVMFCSALAALGIAIAKRIGG